MNSAPALQASPEPALGLRRKSLSTATLIAQTFVMSDRTALFSEQRYRRQFLASDRRQNAAAFLIVCLAYMASFYNDYRLLRGSAWSYLSLAAHLLQAAVTAVSAVLMLRARSPQQYDCAFILWILAVAAANVPIYLLRLPSGEYLGVLFSLGVLFGIYYFALHGPLWPRVVAAALGMVPVVVLLWNPRAVNSLFFRYSAVIALIFLNAVGIFSARSFTAQRRKQCSAERQERLARQMLALKLRELAAEKNAPSPCRGCVRPSWPR